MWEHARKLEFLDKTVSKSKLSEKDALEISEAVKKRVVEEDMKKLREETEKNQYLE